MTLANLKDRALQAIEAVPVLEDPPFHIPGKGQGPGLAIPGQLALAALRERVLRDVGEIAGDLAAIDMSAPGAEHKVVDAGALLVDLEKTCEETRSELTLAWDRRNKAINAFFRGIASSVAAVRIAAEGKLRDWRNEQLRKQREAEEKARAEARRVAEEEDARRREAEKVLDAYTAPGSPEVVAPHPALLDQAFAPPSPPPAPATPVPTALRAASTELGAGKVTEVLSFEVVAPWDVPRELMHAPEPAKAAISQALKVWQATHPGAQEKGEVPTIAGLKVMWAQPVDFKAKR